MGANSYALTTPLTTMHRGLAGLALLLLVAAPVAAEWGAYDDRGFPVNVDGESTYPGSHPPGSGAIGAPASGLAGSQAAEPVNEVGPATLYPYYPILTAEVQRLADEHPEIVKLHSAGKSVAGLDLWMLEIANFDEVEAGDGLPLEEREVVWVDGGTHSNEYSAVYFVLHLASFLADGYGENETATWIVENRHTWIMPMVNPDGSHAMGRLNAHAVNINRNYPVDWGEVDESPVLNNPGPEPASEPETRINIDWFNKTQPDYYASVHCCGNLWLYPYGVEGWDPVDNDVLSRVCDEAFASVREDCGPIWSTIYPASGSSVDTVYQWTGAVGFGYEMSGRGAVALWGQPFTTEEVREQEHESWDGLMHAFENVHLYGAYPAIRHAEMDDEALRVTVENRGYGNLTAGTLTVTAIDGTTHTVELPRIDAEQRVQVQLPAVPHGTGDLTLTYQEREQAAPVDHVTTTALLSQGTFIMPATQAPLEGFATSGIEPSDEQIPGPGASVAVLVLSGLALIAG